MPTSCPLPSHCQPVSASSMENVHTARCDVSDDELARRATARVGAIIGRKFRLDALLGVGGFGAVYAVTSLLELRPPAISDDASKTVATVEACTGKLVVKVMHPELARYAALRERFLREAYLANHVDHHGVVPIFFDGIATEQGFNRAPFLVMPRLYGRTLEERVRAKGPLSSSQLLHVAEHLLSPLVVAHARGIFHRDVKPANVFLTHGREVKLLDWGIGRAPELSRLTTRGASMGTLDFMAPEALFGDELDARSDVFSVGATLFLAATGHTIRGGRAGGLGEFLRAVVDAGTALETAAPALPPPITKLITKALCFRRRERHADAGVMLAALPSGPR